MTSPGADGGSQLRTRVESSGDIDETLLTGEDSSIKPDDLQSNCKVSTYPVERRSGR